MTRLTVAVAVVFLGCGGSAPEEEPAEVAVVVAKAETEERCTVNTLKPGWECCEDDGLLCTSSGIVVCRSHRWEPMTTDDCRRIESDPRRPEFRTFGEGHFCAVFVPQWCPSNRHQD